ncbi:MAG: S9 family peptidase, partial [Acidobacteriaceae bacterium]|nr:S9 family peptidase [Acidobacteriaceae bacterium]
DSRKLLLVLQEKDEADKEDAKQKNKDGEEKPPKPIVIDRYHFKEDIEGYLGPRRNHIYVFDIATEKLEQITNDAFDETAAQWSPDGTRIAFVSNQDKDPDRSHNTDVFVMDAKRGAAARRLTSFSGPDTGPLAWSPDGKWIAYLQGSESKYDAYNLDRLAVVSPDSGGPRVLTGELDRGVSDPVFSQDGSSIVFVVADDRSEYPAQVAVTGGTVERLVKDPLVVSRLSSRSGHTAALVTTDYAPNEVYALEGKSLRQITHHNDALLRELNLAHVEPVSFKSKDGTDVHGLVFEPPNFDRGKKYPALLRIHGGPDGQDGHDFDFERQFLAARGYVVLAVNYRGSSGRGQEYQKTIFADWGDKEVADLLAGVDHIVAMGIADPDHLGIGGWSYGGILTDYTIASDQRFKGAISGAGSANQITMYGTDEYVFQYDNEIGPPWRNQNLWIKLSYPFFHADRIHTPTLFMGGDKDFNVPLIGSEQMYEALKTLGVPTQLVIYPGQFHSFTRPSFVRDRYERYAAWYDKYVKSAPAPSENAAAPTTSGSR